MTRDELIALARAAAAGRGLDPALVCALITQESAWDTFAVRCESESGFMARYGAAYLKIVKASATKIDDKWIRFEDLFYTSYGLMQTMYPVIIETFPEASARLTYPTTLCDPAIGLDYGCRLLKKKLGGAKGDLRQGLLNWNGGADKAYPDKVLRYLPLYSTK